MESAMRADGTIGPTHNPPSASEVVTLRRLWLGLERAREAIARSMLAIRESRELLRGVDRPGGVGFKRTDGHNNGNLNNTLCKQLSGSFGPKTQCQARSPAKA